MLRSLVNNSFDDSHRKKITYKGIWLYDSFSHLNTVIWQLNLFATVRSKLNNYKRQCIKLYKVIRSHIQTSSNLSLISSLCMDVSKRCRPNNLKDLLIKQFINNYASFAHV